MLIGQSSLHFTVFFLVRENASTTASARHASLFVISSLTLVLCTRKKIQHFSIPEFLLLVGVNCFGFNFCKRMISSLLANSMEHVKKKINIPCKKTRQKVTECRQMKFFGRGSSNKKLVHEKTGEQIKNKDGKRIRNSPRVVNVFKFVFTVLDSKWERGAWQEYVN